MKKAMATISTLLTKDEKARAECLREYIDSARRESSVIEVIWHQSYWPNFGYFINQASANKPGKRSDIAVDLLLHASIIEFAKAYIAERYMVNPGQSRDGNITRLQAIRMLELAALDLRGNANPLFFDLGVFDKAATLAQMNFAHGGAHKIGLQIQKLAEMLAQKGILPARFGQWKNPIKQANNTSITVGGEADVLRKIRLPDQAAIDALAAIFSRNLDTQNRCDFRDIYTTSVVALLMCAPSRGEEIHRLPHNLVFEATDKFGKDQFGLRLHASKGFGAYVKWVWSEMVPVAEKAIERLKAISEEGRKLARHMENSKDSRRFYRHENCPQVADNEPLTHVQMCEALGLSASNPPGSLNSYLSRTSLGWDVRKIYTLQMLWDGAVLPSHRKHHPHFPYVSARDKALGKKGGLKYSDSLFCMRRQELSLNRACASPVELWMPSLRDFTHTVVPGIKRTSIFDKYGYTDENGDQLMLQSHQIRHLINTEGQRSGLTDEQIAHWSGRKDVKQNTVYDHRTTAELVDQARTAVAAVQDNVSLVGKNAMGETNITQGQWVIKFAPRLRSTTDLTDIQPLMSGLKTLYGECHHDWAFEPCPGFVKCLDCREHACIKGANEDAKTTLARLYALRSSVIQEVEKAKQASEDDVSAMDWLKVQERYAAKVDQLIEIFESDSVPEGSVIRSADGQHPSHLHRALRGIARKAIATDADSKSAMQNLLLAVDVGLAGTQQMTTSLIDSKLDHRNSEDT